MNPLFLIGGAAAAFFIYESTQNNKAQNKNAPANKIPLASSRFSNMKENPFQQKERLLVGSVTPTQKGQLENPALAGRWLLTTPDGCIFPWVGSFNLLKRKVKLQIPDAKKTPRGLVPVGHNSEYFIDTIEALQNK